MIDFSEFKIIDDQLLSRLNTAIDAVLLERRETKLDYSLIEKLVALVVNESHFIANPMVRVAPQLTQEEIIGYALEFYKSFGGKIYKDALNTLIQLYPHIKLNIYDPLKPKTLDERNEFGHLEYSSSGQCFTTYGNSTITVPLRRDLGKEFVFDNKYSIDSLFTLVHEIAHSLDVDVENGREVILGKQLNTTRVIFCECTSIAFEYLLSQYLLDYSDIHKDAIQEHSILINNYTRRDAITVYAKLVLANEKEKNGKIDYEFIKKSMNMHHLFKDDIRNTVVNITKSRQLVFYRARYAIARLIAPTVVKAYNNKGVESLEAYLNEMKTGDIDRAASVLGIDLKNDGMAQLVRNMLNFESSISPKDMER